MVRHDFGMVQYVLLHVREYTRAQSPQPSRIENHTFRVWLTLAHMRLISLAPIVCSRSVDCGFRTEVYVTVECTYLKYLLGGEAALLYYVIGMCVAVSLPRESV